MRVGSVYCATLVTPILLGCDAPTRVHSLPDFAGSTMTLDSIAQVGTLQVRADDADGPVHIECTGAFPGEGSDTLTLVRTFAELHTFEFVITICAGSQAADKTWTSFSVPDQYAINKEPQVDRLTGPIDVHPGVPSQWTVHITDDWGLRDYAVHVYADSLNDGCLTATERIYYGSWSVPGRTVVDTTVIITFPTTGRYCSFVSARDDVGNGVGTGGDAIVTP